MNIEEDTKQISHYRYKIANCLRYAKKFAKEGNILMVNNDLDLADFFSEKIQMLPLMQLLKQEPIQKG
jgi:hypothetical protein